jgi:sporulation integral membrane protein YlbJ
MKKTVKNGLLIIFMIATFALMVTSTTELIGAVNKAIMLWATRVFPVLFPFYIIGILFVKYGVAHFIGGCLSPITQTLFKTKPISGFVFVISLLSGNPQSAVMISALYNNGELSEEESEHLLKFSVFMNPLFIIGTIGVSYFHNLTIGLIVLIAHVLSNILLGILLRSQIKNRKSHNLSLKKSYQNMVHNQTKDSIGEVLTQIIQKGLNVMFLVCGFMIFFNIVIVLLVKSKIIDILFTIITFNQLIPIPYEIFYACTIGILEVTNFIDTITKTDLNLRMMVTLITVFVSFGGLSIHAQIHSVLEKVKIRYGGFFLYRIFQMFISGLIAYYLFPFFYKEKTSQTIQFDDLQADRNLTLASILILVAMLAYIWVYYKQKKRMLQ